jgi:dUTPase
MSILYVYSPDEEVRRLMRENNASRRKTDSGFDIPLVNATVTPVEGCSVYCIGQNVYVGAVCFYYGCPVPTLLLPRSSLSKTPYRLANSIGLIDSGYRGEVKAMVDVVGEPKEIADGTRLFQLVAHNFLPWLDVRIVDQMEDLPTPPDSRGSGGFGSTGQ